MRRAYCIAFSLCAAAASLPLLLTSILPMADLPEHMAQVTLWKHLADPCFGYGNTFELNFATPYLLGYLISRLFAVVMTVSAATKLTVWLSILLLPLSIRSLMARTAADPWLSLLGFPLAYGYVFYWGFLNFALAVSIGLFFVALLHDERPRIVVLSLVALVLLAAHALMFLFCAIVALGVAVLRKAPRLLIPLAVPGALFLWFIVRLRQAEEASHEGITWWKRAHERLLDLPSLLLANAWEPFGLLVLALMAIAVVVALPRMTRLPSRWVLFAAAMILYLFAPLTAFGSTFLYPRFLCPAVVGALFLLEAPRRRQALSRALVIAIVLFWMGVLAVRFRSFGEETKDYARLLASMPANRRVVVFNVEPFSDNVPGPVYWHFGALYQVRRGGLIAWSFANYYPQLVRYRPGKEPVLHAHAAPINGIDWPGVLQYDYLLLRGVDPRRSFFRNAPAGVVLARQEGAWWLFETPRARGPQRECPPLNE